MAACGLDYWEGEAPGPYTGLSEAERLDAVKLPPGLRKVHLFPDNNGEPGRKAAERAKWHYYEQYNVDVETWWPPKGQDWNDFLRGKK
jgi:DNA topoisomerase IB